MAIFNSYFDITRGYHEQPPDCPGTTGYSATRVLVCFQGAKTVSGGIIITKIATNLVQDGAPQ